MIAQPLGMAMMRALVCALMLSLLAATGALAADAAFQNFLQSLWPEAQKLGVSRATFDAATQGIEPDVSLPDLVRPDAGAAAAGRIRADAGGLCAVLDCATGGAG
jgi:membrane-bound lytic murein transglycosylase B